MAKKIWTAKDVEFLQIIAQDVVSLNTLVGGPETDKETELADCIMDPQPGPEELSLKNNTRETLLKIIKELRPREQQILLLRYGFHNGKYMTLEDIGKEFNVTRERIRQIEAKALRQIKIKLKMMNIEKVADI